MPDHSDFPSTCKSFSGQPLIHSQASIQRIHLNSINSSLGHRNLQSLRRSFCIGSDCDSASDNSESDDDTIDRSVVVQRVLPVPLANAELVELDDSEDSSSSSSFNCSTIANNVGDRQSKPHSTVDASQPARCTGTTSTCSATSHPLIQPQSGSHHTRLAPIESPNRSPMDGPSMLKSANRSLHSNAVHSTAKMTSSVGSPNASSPAPPAPPPPPPPIRPPLRGLLKKTQKPEPGTDASQKRRRVRFADTMMVFCDDWPEELMPQILAVKSPSDLSLVEVAAQGYMFEPPAEYKDMLPFDPPPDYRDCCATAATTFADDDDSEQQGAAQQHHHPHHHHNQQAHISLETIGYDNLSSLPNHALLQMYEREAPLDRLTTTESHLAALDSQAQQELLHSYGHINGTQIGLYQDLILSGNDEMLEEDAIIGVLKEDDILQAIGSQPQSHIHLEQLQTLTNDSLTSEDQMNTLNQSAAEANDSSGGNQSPTSSLMQDIASESSVTSQDTIILMTSAMLTDSSNPDDNSSTLREPLSSVRERRDSTGSKDSQATEMNSECDPDLDCSTLNPTISISKSISITSASSSERDAVQSSDENNNLQRSSNLAGSESPVIVNDSNGSVATIRQSFERQLSHSIANPLRLSTFAQCASTSMPMKAGLNCSHSGPDQHSNELHAAYSSDAKVQPNRRSTSLSTFGQLSGVAGAGSAPTPLNSVGLNDELSLNSIEQKSKMDDTERYSNLDSSSSAMGNDSRSQSTNNSLHSFGNTLPPTSTLTANNMPSQQPTQSQTSQHPPPHSGATVSAHLHSLTPAQLNALVASGQLSGEAAAAFQVPPRLPLNSNLYLSIDRRALSHQLKAVPLNRPSPPPYTDLNNKPVNGPGSASSISQQQAQQQMLAHHHLLHLNALHNSTCAQNAQQTMVHATLPLRLMTNAKDLAGKKDANASNSTDSGDGNNGGKSAQPNVSAGSMKPQLILIQTNSNLNGGNNLSGASIGPGGSGSMPAIAIKIHPGSMAQAQLAAAAAVAQANNACLMNSTAKFYQQSLLAHQQLKSGSSHFPNASEIRRRDGLHAIPNSSSSHNCAGELSGSGGSKEQELEAFVQQDLQRTERIRQRYASGTDEEEDDPTFGFARRPSVRGIKPRLAATGTPLLRQLHIQSSNDLKNQSVLIGPGTGSSSAASPVGSVNTSANSPANDSSSNAKPARPTSQIILSSQLLQQQAILLQQAQLNKQQQQQSQQQTNTISSQPTSTGQSGQPSMTNAVNGQRHVYLISNTNMPGYQQRILHAGGTLPRVHQQHQLQLLQKQAFQLQQQQQQQFAQQNQSNSLKQANNANNNSKINNGAASQSCRMNGLNPNAAIIGQPRPNSSMSNEAHQPINSKVPVAIQGQHSGGTKQVIYYQPTLQMASGNSNPTINSGTANATATSNSSAVPTSNPPQPLQYKTISMPNVALLKSCPQVITLISSKEAHTLQEPPKIQLIASPNKHLTAPTSTSDPSSSSSMDDSSKSTTQHSQAAASLATGNNNPDLVKDVQNRTVISIGCVSKSDGNIQSDNGRNAVNNNSGNKDGLIFYSMNV